MVARERLTARPEVRRFVSKFRVSDGCWLWEAATNKGYGFFWLDGGTTSAHRVACATFDDPIPDGLVSHHRCGNKSCVRPDHIARVTQWENLLKPDGGPARSNFVKTHCKHGHEFTEENTYVRPTGTRECRTCRRRIRRRYP